MKLVNLHWFLCVCISHPALLGIYTFLLELCQCQVHSGVKWPPYSSSLNSTGISISHVPGNQQTVELPQMHSPQTRLTVQTGDTIQLPCKVYNIGDSQVLWRHGTNILAGSNITTYSDSRIDLLEDLTLKISKVTRIDEGDYECIVTSWPSLSLVHSVAVHDAPTVSLLTTPDITLTEGETVEIGCIPQGNPLPRVSWSMRDGNIPIHKSLLNQSRLALESVTRKYTGLYVCIADNGVGRPAIGAVYVRVRYPPEIEIPRRRAHGGIGLKTQLVGLVHGDPKPEVHWRKGKELILKSDWIFPEVHESNEYRLIFNSVKPSDFATYTIEANNSLGADAKNIEFSGIPNAPILARWETEDIEGIQVTLYWAAECYSPLIDYRLFFRPAVIPPPSNPNEENPGAWTQLTVPADKFSDSQSFLHTKSFTLRGLNHSSIYEAAVKARNKFGWSPLSSVCYFGTFPNSSSSKSQDIEQIMKKMKQDEGIEMVKEELSRPESDFDSTKVSSSARLSLSGWIFNSYLSLIVVAGAVVCS